MSVAYSVPWRSSAGRKLQRRYRTQETTSPRDAAARDQCGRPPSRQGDQGAPRRPQRRRAKQRSTTSQCFSEGAEQRVRSSALKGEAGIINRQMLAVRSCRAFPKQSGLSACEARQAKAGGWQSARRIRTGTPAAQHIGKEQSSQEGRRGLGHQPANVGTTSQPRQRPL